MANSLAAIIFNGIFETRKSTGIEQKNAKMRVKNASPPRIYHSRINHDEAVGVANGLLGTTNVSRAILSSEAYPGSVRVREGADIVGAKPAEAHL